MGILQALLASGGSAAPSTVEYLVVAGGGGGAPQSPSGQRHRAVGAVNRSFVRLALAGLVALAIR